MKIGIYCNIEKHMYIEVEAPTAEQAAELNRRGEIGDSYEIA